MNKLTIIGNLTRDPELRTTQSGVNVCSFTLAVNRRKTANNPDPGADYFRVSAWRGLADNCARFLAKGRKAAVVGPVSVSTYTANDGSTRAQLEVTADDVEFLTSRSEGSGSGVAAPANAAPASGYQQQAMQGYQAIDGEDLPF